MMMTLIGITGILMVTVIPMWLVAKNRDMDDLAILVWCLGFLLLLIYIPFEAFLLSA